MRIVVIGAGNGGQAIAGFLAIKGHNVSLYDRSQEKINELRSIGEIELVGKIHGFGKIDCFTTKIGEAIKGAEVIMITIVANAHIDIARQMAPYIEDNQIIVLNPGRTCGALVFKQALENSGCNKRFYIGEAQTLVYACRIITNGKVNVIGVKDEVLFAGLPATDTDYILNKVNVFYPCCN